MIQPADIHNYHEVESRIRQIQVADSNSYRKAAIVLAILGLLGFLLLWIVGLILLITAALLYLNSTRNKAGNSTMFFSRITDRRHYHYESVGGDPAETQLPKMDHYQFSVQVQQSFEVHKDKAIPRDTPEPDRIVRVNEVMFRQFNTGDDLVFVLTPVNDLIAWLKVDKLEFLTTTYTFSDGTTKDILSGIDQKPRSGMVAWEDVTDVER